MREIQLLVTLRVEDVEPEKDTTEATMVRAATDAVTNVLNHAQGVGFPHDWEEYLSITVKSVKFDRVTAVG
jgi:hypothetical protein